ncbi:MAG: hypothetical protein JST20_04850 [Bacteroidetes bacterium]|nr:hypothetical protein [Bacteroidota bacterium]
MRVVLGDKKTKTGNNPFVPEVVSYSGYFPFGMQMQEETSTGNTYRYGYNGQEMDKDINSTGNITTAEFWEYDSRAARRWNRDPKPDISISNYATFANNPILFFDHMGDYIHSDQEGFDVTNEGLTATLGANNPFSRNQTTGLWEVDNTNLNIANYNPTQKEIYAKLFAEIGNTHTTIEVKIVEQKDLIQNIIGQLLYKLPNSNMTLFDRGAQGLTDPMQIPPINVNQLTDINIYIARHNFESGYRANSDDNQNDQPRGLTALHELGHAFYFMDKPSLTLSDNLLLTSRFENRVRDIYQIPVNWWDKFCHWFTFSSTPLPTTKPIEGDVQSHTESERKQLNIQRK